MKKIFITSLIAVLGFTMSAPEVSAQRPGRSEHQRVERNRGQRPGKNNSGSFTRPGNNNNNHAVRPGNNHPGNNNNNHAVRPGNNRPGNNQTNRPGFNRPAPSHKPAPVNRPGVRPHLRPGVSRPAVMHRPYRPGYAPARPLMRPTPPPSWRAPRVRVNLWSNILGISIGMTINNAIDHLLYDGYTVTGYNGNEIFMSNVPMYNLYWPDATMYYNNGALMGSRFYYSTYGYDTARYRSVYDHLFGLYGAPVSSVSTAEGMTVTWYGSNNQYITLDYGPTMTDAGRRYFTTLSIGL